MSRRRAFTLVELLVVIGIIAVLIGMLLPTLVGARRSAKTTRCAANLRSLGQAVVMYANEHKGYIPTYRTSYGSLRLPWYDQLARYVFNRPATGTPPTPPTIANDPDFERSIFVGCPEFPFYKLTGTGVLNTSTGYGITALPIARLEPPDPGPANQMDGTLPATKARAFRLVELKNPTNRALLGDMNGWGGLRALDANPVDTYTRIPYPPTAPPQGDIDYYRHGKLFDLNRRGVNIAFADGHVELCTPWGAWYAVRDPARRGAGSDKGY